MAQGRLSTGRTIRSVRGRFRQMNWRKSQWDPKQTCNPPCGAPLHLRAVADEFAREAALAQFLRLKVNFKRSKANHLASADVVWHRLVASIGKSLTLSRVCATPATVVMRLSNARLVLVLYRKREQARCAHEHGVGRF